MNESEPEVPLDAGSHSQAARVGQTVRRVRRVRHPWSSNVFELLQHVEREGFRGAPRALGFDERGREILTYVDGSAGVDLPDADAGSVRGVDHWIWRDDVLVQLGVLVRRYHDAAATFSWAGREWQLEVRQPVETVCHNDLAPSNVVFRAGVPVALIDWEAAAPGPRAWDLGFAAWAGCRSGRRRGVARRVYRRAPLRRRAGSTCCSVHMALSRTWPSCVRPVNRMRHFLDHLSALAAADSEWEVQLARRGLLGELEGEIGWVERHAAELVAS